MSVEVDIHKNLGDFALNAAFSAGDGVLGLLGSSGCGKSLTLRSIAGIETPDRGRIVLNGWTCFDSSRRVNLPPQKRRVGIMFQNYALFPNMTVEQNLLCAIDRKASNRRQRLNELLERFELAELRSLRPSQLSGGQQQRTALARCVGMEPSVLLLDEPFSALDAHLKADLQLRLREQLRTFPGTVILVTHDRDEAYLLCDSIAVMDRGHIIAADEKGRLFRNPKTAAAARLTGCKNVVSARKAGDYAVFVPDWRCTLTTAQPVPNGLTAVGIRAHDFYPINETRTGAVELTGGTVTEFPFEWSVLLRTIGGGTVHWKVPKGMLSGTPPMIPKRLAVLPENVLLLEG